MKTIKTLVILFLLFTTVVCAFADGLAPKPDTLVVDSIADTISVIKDTVSVVQEPVVSHEESSFNLFFILSLLVSLYEVFARFIPTVKDISILSWMMKLISMMLPNMRKGGGKHII